MKVLFIRHGDPDYSIDSLTEKGWREARFLGDRITKLNVKSFYCSPLGRAMDTASITLNRLGRTVEILDWLKEFEASVIDPVTGKKLNHAWDLMPPFWTEQKDLYDKDKWVKTSIMQSCGEVEREYKVVTYGIDSILEKHGYIRYNNRYTAKIGNTDTIVIFCHLGVQFAMLSHILGISPSVLWQNFFVAPSSVTTLVTEEREKGEVSFRCQAIGDTSHLYVFGEEISFSGRFCEVYENEDERH